MGKRSKKKIDVVALADGEQSPEEFSDEELEGSEDASEPSEEKVSTPALPVENSAGGEIPAKFRKFFDKK